MRRVLGVTSEYTGRTWAVYWPTCIRTTLRGKLGVASVHPDFSLCRSFVPARLPPRFSESLMGLHQVPAPVRGA